MLLLLLLPAQDPPQQLLLLCRPRQLHKALRQHHLPDGLLIPVGCLAGM
jgi:hypothetical protein